MTSPNLGRQMMKKSTWLLIAVVLLILFGVSLVGVYLDYLWFSNLGYASVFITLFTNRFFVQVAAFLFFFLVLFINLLWSRRAVLEMSNLKLRQALMNTPAGNIIAKNRITIFFAAASFLLAALFSGYTGNYWFAIRQFFSAQPFGVVDPIFSRDVGFYVFSLPFYNFLNQYLSGVLLMALMVVGGLYLLTSPPEFSVKRLSFLYEGGGHLSLLLALFFITKAWGYRLATFGLIHSTRGGIFGAGYTDVNAQLPALNILMVLALVCAVALIANIFLKKPRIILFCGAGLIVASVLVGSIYPSLVQKLQVEPNQFNREQEFINHNISYTRQAFGLENITNTNFLAVDTLTPGVLLSNINTLNNVRLWDYRPLKDTFNQLQGIRLYYRFTGVDSDRYMIDGEYRQVMVAARELDKEMLPAESQTWVNQRLQYTHGYGVAMTPVNEVTSEGLPTYFISDVPPRTAAGIELTRPQIYYGELTGGYVIVNTLTEEFDYPMGSTNAYTTYEGTGGVPLGGLLQRILFAVKMGDYQILLSGDVKPDSRVMFNRNIAERTQKITPFLKMDRDPYIVVNDGRLFWIRDAYTSTDLYPYSQKFGQVNYIRNSVKIVVDAYNGDVSYYIADPEDPIIQTYAGVFPGLFKPMDEMPEGLKAHLRYPMEMFSLQATVLSTYHMQDARVFYTKEDQWQFPTENYGGQAQVMEPYYTTIQLPGEDKEEFVLMLPFTPNKRNNMIGWMAARMDGPQYGELILYNFPKDRTIWGPQQIEARIDQNSLISQQISLWDQRGSSVIRGNLLVLPIADSILYVEPLYLRSDQSQLPELARVIVSYGDMVIMEETLEKALEQVFGQFREETPSDPDEVEEPAIPIDRPISPGDDPELRQILQRVADLFNQAQESLKEGNWAEYGRLIEEMEALLQSYSGN